MHMVTGMLGTAKDNRSVQDENVKWYIYLISKSFATIKMKNGLLIWPQITTE